MTGLPESIRQVLVQILGKDDSSIELFRLLAVMSIPGYLLLSTVDLFFISHNWSPLEFGGGLSAVLLAVAGAIRIKEGPTTQPMPSPAPIIQNAQNVQLNPQNNTTEVKP